MSDKILADHLQVYECETSLRGDILSESHKPHIIKVVTAFLKQGLSLQKT